MKTDVAGRVRNTSLAASKPLLPLYEAVVNSIQAIEDANEKQGNIKISVLRDRKHLFEGQAPELGDITGFEITDNGIGFNEDNYRAFETADTTYKAGRGGKGVGRFLWLVAFECVQVASHTKHGRKMQLRRFTFVPEGDGVKDMTVVDAQRPGRSTTVRLTGFRAKYQQQCPKRLDTIGTHLIEHCLEFFIRADCPAIVLEDSSTEERLDLNERFEQEMASLSKRDRVCVEGQQFEVLHVRLRSSHFTEHLIHFCANSRVVKSEKLLGRLPNLARRLQDEEGRDFVYAAYVDSNVLDGAVNAERTEFSIMEDASDLLVKDITWQAIREALFDNCRVFLKPYTEPVRERKNLRIDRFVASDGPMYRPILKYVDATIDLIDPEINDDALDLRLYAAYHDLQVALRAEGQVLLQKDAKDEEWDEYISQLQEYFDKIGDINKSDLARYVCHRRAVLDFLQRQLSVEDDGKYRREDRVHQIIFPMRKTSDDVLFEEHNLWLLDEKLVYHAFLASDKPLRTTPNIGIVSSKEPDILVFDKACAFATGDPPYSAVTIIEFKRPMRKDFNDDDENPFVQMRGYITDIRDGKARTPSGRDIPVIGHDVPFYCYLVADIAPRLEQLAYDFELTRSPDGQGFFGYKRQYNAYVEVVSYSKMVTDAKKRNAAFFEKLGLPTRVKP